MKIIQTINTKYNDTETSLCHKIQNLIDSNCKYIRLNFKNFSQADIERINLLLSCIGKIDFQKSLNIVIDIPVTKNKYKLNTTAPQNIKKGQCIKVVSLPEAKFPQQTKALNYVEESFFNFLRQTCLGETFFWGDGEAILKLEEKQQKYMIFRSNNNFLLYDNKSLSNSRKDFHLNTQHVEYLKNISQNYNITDVFLSFCEYPGDILKIKNYLPNISIGAKIETEMGVKNLTTILDTADSIMIARGDLALNIPVNKFLYTQDLIARNTNIKNKKLFIATDILTSLNKQEFPSRADLCDIEKILTYSPEAIILKAASFHNNRFAEIKNFIENIS